MEAIHLPLCSPSLWRTSSSASTLWPTARRLPEGHAQLLQYYAAAAISDKVRRCKWDERPKSSAGASAVIFGIPPARKTMTSFKSAQLIADSHDADKVVFLMDRIELGTQSLSEYRAFADDLTTCRGPRTRRC